MAVATSTAQLINQFANQYGVPSYFLGSIVEVESSYNPNTIGDNGKSFGLLQLYTGGGQGNGYTKQQLLDPATNLEIGVPPIATAYKKGLAKGLNGYNLLSYTAGNSGHPWYKGTLPGYYDTALKRAWKNGDEISQALGGKSVIQLTFNKVQGKTTGVSNTLLTRLNNLAEAKGKTINISSGYRSIEEQTALWNNSDKSGKMVAKPGNSRHQYGLAVDVSDNWLKSMSNAELKKYNLYKPMDYENWHIEPIETKGKVGSAQMQAVRMALDGVSGLTIGSTTGVESTGSYSSFTELSKDNYKKLNQLTETRAATGLTDVPAALMENAKAYGVKILVGLLGLILITFALIQMTRGGGI